MKFRSYSFVLPSKSERNEIDHFIALCAFFTLAATAQPPNGGAIYHDRNAFLIRGTSNMSRAIKHIGVVDA